MTKQVTVTWQGERRFIADDHHDGYAAIGAPNPAGNGMGASHLLLAALGGCVGTTVIGVLEKKRQDVTAFEIEITGEHLPDWPKTFTSIHIIYRVTGNDVQPAAVERAAELAGTRYCTVSTSIAAPITESIELINLAEAVPA